jgi:RND superfamily putative drug exporter
VVRKTPELARLQTLISRVSGVAGVVGPRDEAALGQQFASLARNGNAARFLVVLDRDPFSAAAIDRVRRLQHALPSLLSQSGLAETRVGVAGESALSSETVAASRAALLRLAIAALAVNLVFLVVFLRSLIAPLYLLMASALALAATLGLTVTISQRVLGYPELTYYVPFAAAVLLLSLGSDYNIFVVGRIWEEARHRPVEDAVASAAPKASLSISAAGFVMAMAFAVLAIVPLIPFRELALVMALGVLVDALLVRSLLAPALVTAFGEFGGWPGSRLTHWRTRHGVGRESPSAVPPDAPALPRSRPL